MNGNSAIGEAAIRAGCQCYFGYPITPQNELIEYMATNMSRGGPGLGSIVAAQSDYFQATRGGGHGDYRTIVLAPSSVQELADLTHRAFGLADKYKIPVIILGDGMLGQMMEPVEFKYEAPEELPVRANALRGARGRPSRYVKTFTSK